MKCACPAYFSLTVSVCVFSLCLSFLLLFSFFFNILCDRVPVPVAVISLCVLYVQLQLIQYAGVAFVYFDIWNRVYVLQSLLLSFHLFYSILSVLFVNKIYTLSECVCVFPHLVDIKPSLALSFLHNQTFTRSIYECFIDVSSTILFYINVYDDVLY